MSSLADLLKPGDLEHRVAPNPILMVATVLDVDGDTGALTVTVPTLDNAARAITAFGTFPGAQPGDEVRVQADELGELVVTAWSPA